MHDAVMAGTPANRPPPAVGRPSPLERLASFRVTYLAIFFFIVAYVFTVEGLEELLGVHFAEQVVVAASVNPADGPVATQVSERVQAVLRESPWIRWGEVRVRPLVLAADGRTILYGAGQPLAPTDDPAENAQLVPALVDISVAVPHNGVLANGVLLSYASLLLSGLFFYNRRLTRQEQQEIDRLQRARDVVADRAREIETELGSVRDRLSEVEPEKEIYAEEIESLSAERTRLLSRLSEVEQREADLRRETDQGRDLDEERRALEELLDDATRDLASKDEEILDLRSQVKRAGRGQASRGKESEILTRRYRTLYKELEVDDRAIADLIALGDESLRLRAEEALKTLSEDPDNAIVRRKVGGLPPHLSIFEMAFAGKGRLYTTKGRTRRVRLLLVGQKSTQKPDLEYLSRLPRES